jgi:hypothetical protein
LHDARRHPVITGSGWPRLAQPDAALRNGTLTFVKSGGRTYGITCQHVVQHYRDVLAASGEPGSHTMRTMLNGFHVVIDRFVQPQVQFGNPAPDIAIREINPDHIAHIGKEAMDLDSMKEAPEDMRHAEKLKYQKYDNHNQLNHRVSLPIAVRSVSLKAHLPFRFTQTRDARDRSSGRRKTSTASWASSMRAAPAKAMSPSTCMARLPPLT